MAEVTGYTADRMKAIEDGTVTTGAVDGTGHLILTHHDGTTVDAGYVVGPQGATGGTGPTGPSGAITGEIKMYGKATAPSGYLLCDGSAVSRTAYSALYAVIGTTYGAGDGSTTFNVPNMAAKFPRGNTPGTGGGVDTHVHTGAVHTHTQGSLAAQLRMSATDGALHGNVVTVPAYNGNTQLNATSPTATTLSRTNGIAVAGTTDNSSAANTGSASNIPAYTGVAFIIKT